MTDKTPGRGSDQFPLRLPEGMRDAIKEAATINKRSMNAEIVDRLEQSFAQSPSDETLKLLLQSDDREAALDTFEFYWMYSRMSNDDRVKAREMLQAVKNKYEKKK